MRENGPESAPEGHGPARAPTFNTSELQQTGRASPGWAWTRSGRQLTGTFGRPGGELLSEHIEVESGKNNDRQQLQPCHLARLARNQVRFGLRQAAQCGGAAANASGERRPGQAAASEPSQAPPGLAGIGPKASRRACRKLWRRPHDGPYRPQFHALFTVGRPKQTDSIRFCSHTVQAPAKPNPFRNHSMASNPRIVRRAVWKD